MTQQSLRIRHLWRNVAQGARGEIDFENAGVNAKRPAAPREVPGQIPTPLLLDYRVRGHEVRHLANEIHSVLAQHSLQAASV